MRNKSTSQGWGGGCSQSATAVTKLQLSSGPHETPSAAADGRPGGYVVVGDEAAHIGARAGGRGARGEVDDDSSGVGFGSHGDGGGGGE